MNDDIPTLRRILQDNRVVAVVGLSASWYRPSYFAAKYLQDHGYRIVPVNPRYQEVLGARCHPDLATAAVHAGPIDVVDCFRRAEDIAPIVRAVRTRRRQRLRNASLERSFTAAFAGTEG